jgi:hypothetical protein
VVRRDLTVDSASSRVPARRPGNFHLLAQMKVTKAKCLNTHLCGEDGGFTDALFEAPWGSARCLLDPSSLRDFIGRKSLLVHGWYSRRRLGGRLRLDRDSIAPDQWIDLDPRFSRSLNRLHGSSKSCPKPTVAHSSRQDHDAAKRRATPRGNGSARSVVVNRELLLNRCLAKCVFRHFALVTFICASKWSRSGGTLTSRSEVMRPPKLPGRRAETRLLTRSTVG